MITSLWESSLCLKCEKTHTGWLATEHLWTFLSLPLVFLRGTGMRLNNRVSLYVASSYFSCWVYFGLLCECTVHHGREILVSGAGGIWLYGICSQGAECDQCGCSARFLLFIGFDPSLGNVQPTCRVSLSSSANLIKIILCIHPEACLLWDSSCLLP